MRARAGMTLVEVMLAGSIAALATVALLEGLVVIAKVGRENSQLLAAEAYAWDVAWKWLNKSYDSMGGTAAGQWFPDASGAEVPEADCPALSVWPGSPMRCWVRVKAQEGGDAVLRHGVAETASKLVEVDVEWGPPGGRKRLSPDLRASSAPSFNTPVRVVKCSMDRGRE